jgi:hypothetical protein
MKVVMLKKRAMSTDRYIETSFGKKLIIGYSGNQLSWPYWVYPQNYSAIECNAMNDWMKMTFGDVDWSIKGLWVGSDKKYWFRNESDRTFFILRWS